MMFKKRSSVVAPPILKKVSSFLKVQILILSRKMRKPVISRIISLKKSRNYNYYYYVKEYQFSPSSSPLILHYRNSVMKKKKDGYGGSDLYSMAFVGKCLGMMKEKEGRRSSSNGFMSCYPPRRPLMEEVKVLPSSSSSAEDFFGCVELEDDDDSIDERAEKFIERFYEEMRLQRRQDSFLSF